MEYITRDDKQARELCIIELNFEVRSMMVACRDSISSVTVRLIPVMCHHVCRRRGVHILLLCHISRCFVLHHSRSAYSTCSMANPKRGRGTVNALSIRKYEYRTTTAGFGSLQTRTVAFSKQKGVAEPAFLFVVCCIFWQPVGVTFSPNSPCLYHECLISSPRPIKQRRTKNSDK